MRAKRTYSVLPGSSANAPALSVSQARRPSPQPAAPRRLPRTFRRCPGFDNDCPEFWWGERPREPRCPESKTFRPVFGNDCPDLAGRCPDRKSSCPGSMSHCPGHFRFRPDFQTLAPVLKAVAPISGAPRLFYKLLPQSNLCGIAAKRRKERKKTLTRDPETVN